MYSQCSIETSCVDLDNDISHHIRRLKNSCQCDLQVLFKSKKPMNVLHKCSHTH